MSEEKKTDEIVTEGDSVKPEETVVSDNEQTKVEESNTSTESDSASDAEPVEEQGAASDDDSKNTDEQAEEVITEESEPEIVEESSGPLYPEVVPGTEIRVHQKIKEVNPKGEEKERIQVFEGIVIARKHGSEDGATITVRKVSDGIGVEKIYPLNMPSIAKIEVKRKFRVRRAKLGFLRLPKFKKRLKEIRDQVTGK